VAGNARAFVHAFFFIFLRSSFLSLHGLRQGKKNNRLCILSCVPVCWIWSRSSLHYALLLSSLSLFAFSSFLFGASFFSFGSPIVWLLLHRAMSGCTEAKGEGRECVWVSRLFVAALSNGHAVPFQRDEMHAGRQSIIMPYIDLAFVATLVWTVSPAIVLFSAMHMRGRT